MGLVHNTKSYIGRALPRAALAGCLCGAYPAAHAQDAPATGGGTSDAGAAQLEEVVVTARSRREKEKDVPMTINLVGGADIRDRGLDSVFDLAKLVPSFSDLANVRGQSTVTMRGLSPNNLSPEKQSVGFFVDGMYLPGEATSFNLQDLDHVEVLKGPQAAHFGRSTYAGAVNYITRVPASNEASSRFTVEGSSHGSYEGNGVFNTPMVDDVLYASYSARVYHRGGNYVENNYGTREGEQNSTNLAANFLATPWTGATLQLRASYDWDDDGHQDSYTLYAQNMTQYARTFPTGLSYPVFSVNNLNKSLLGASRVAGIDPDRIGGRTRNREFVYWIWNQDLGGGYTLNYSGEYFYEYNHWLADVTNHWLSDPLLTAPTQVINPTENSTRTYTQQVRLSSPGDDKLQWLVGGFYSHETYITYSQEGRVVLNPFSITGGYPSERDGALVTEDTAGYFSASYPIVGALTATAEGRFQSERLSVEDCDLSQCQRIAAGFAQTSNDFTPRFTLSYKLTPDLLTYALFSEGVKSGVINLSSSAATAAAAHAYELANYQSPERAKNYEVGLKGTLLGGRLSLESAAYHMDITNQQVATFGVGANGVSTSFTGNGGRSSIDGAEISLVGSIMQHWTANVGVGYAHQEFIGHDATNSTLIALFGINDPRATLDGLTSVDTPRWTANAATDYSLTAFGPDVVTLHADWNLIGMRYADIPNFVKIPQQERTNLSARYAHGQNEFTVFVNNLFNSVKPDDASAGYGNIVEQGTHAVNTGAMPSIIVNLPYGRVVGARYTRRF